ncbi:MAG: extracellular solute-binding protein [Anaerolineaceae bacterium]|nr:extracellular solute-binding protein [Anaerolineaceae bacterium]
MQRLLRASVLLIVLSAFLFGGIAQAADPINIRIFVGLGTGDRPDQKDPQDAIAALWNDSHTDIKISFDINANTTARDVLLTQAAGDNPPDLIGPVGIRGLYDSIQLWEDLSPYIEKDKAALNLDDYDPATLKLFQDAGGRNLSVALGIYPSFLYVNEDIFNNAEIPLPPKEFGAKYTDKDGNQVNWDWDEVAVVGKLITSDSNGKYSDEADFDPTKIQNYGYGDFWNSMRHVAMQFGATDSGLAPDGKTADFNQPAFIEAMKWYQKGIFTDHFIPDAAAEGALGQGTTPFESARLGMWYSHTWYSCCVGSAKFNWGIYAAPAVNGTDGQKIVAPLHADTFGMLAKSKNKDAAWEVLKWLNSSEIASQLCTVYGCLPARASARASWEEGMKKQFPGMDLNVVYAAIPYLDIPNHEGYLPNYAQAFDAFQAVWGNIRTDGSLDIQKTMDDLNKTEQGIFEGNFPPTPTPAPTAAS